MKRYSQLALILLLISSVAYSCFMYYSNRKLKLILSTYYPYSASSTMLENQIAPHDTFCPPGAIVCPAGMTNNIPMVSIPTPEFIKPYSEPNNDSGLLEKIYGCYFSKDNINEKINFTRGTSFTYYREGLIRYTQTSGNYEVNQLEHTVTALPYDSSKIVFKVNDMSTNISITSESGTVFDKGSCATFNEY